MVAVKAQQANAVLSRPDPTLVAFLIYGSDAGLVSERCAKLARTLAERDSPPGEIVRIDDADLEDDSERLSVELLTVPMFGGRKIEKITLDPGGRFPDKDAKDNVWSAM